MKLIDAVKDSYCWVRALQYCAKEQYDEAKAILDKSKRRDYEYWTLYAYVCFALGNDKSAVLSTKNAERLIENASISQIDKKYIHAYLSDLICSIEKNEMSFDNIKIDGVSKHLLLNFPLRGHPEWKRI